MHALIFGIGWLISAALAWAGSLFVIGVILSNDPSSIVSRGFTLSAGALLAAAIATNPYVYAGRSARAVAWSVATGLAIALMLLGATFLVLTGTWR